MRLIMRMRVVLPAPFGPKRPKMPPSGMSRLTLSSATFSPKVFVTFLISMIAIILTNNYIA